ncbi:metabolite traffic protein EboE [Marinilongibacter aquaticus]|uniref:metabolite traffic protein EboE n=1 Tax=Marinilongibacter aquaticus TaxID=2975157 RepID=UPI0021BD5FCB|nr:metabolite traffic protein EboE [Marinilongibacter aquaticus]UBM58503.1 metabolite traffic protein EboE [Marinilongibacter aquaticus]
MHTEQHKGHLTYCSNIHPGETWAATFSALKKHIPEIKSQLGAAKFGIGLRLSDQASVDLLEGDNLEEFKTWLASANAYVFTMNGFPFGGFHDVVVKDKVHEPDWLSTARLDYTKRLFDILAELLPAGMDGGVSTSPVSYKYWHKTAEDLEQAKSVGAKAMAEVAIHVHDLFEKTGKVLHLDIEPEPDGVLETGQEFVDFYNDFLLEVGKEWIEAKRPGLDAEEVIRRHLQICFDVCHFAVGFEQIDTALENLNKNGITIGRIQISAALSSGVCNEETDKKALREKLEVFDEPTYLHQAIMQGKSGELRRFRDLGPALEVLEKVDFEEIRSHFHVPIFLDDFNGLKSTQSAISECLKVWKEKNFTNHLEIETYTWSVLPQSLQVDMSASIVRELQWVLDELNRK